LTGTGYEPSGEFILYNKKIKPSRKDKELIETLNAGFLCNNATLMEDEEGYNILGDPTEGALIVSAIKAGISESSPRLDEIPFESERRYMATLHQGKNENVIYVKGSPERILKMSNSQLINGNVQSLEIGEITNVADKMAENALRVIGFAYKISNKKKRLEVEDLNELTFLGIQGMIDPPREEAIKAVEKCRKAGIRTVMITGDHAKTAKAISEQLGIGIDEDRVIKGKELSRMSHRELYEIVDKFSVYARVAPEHKYDITTQLQMRGHIVAVTGDGVNDAPALKAADIGIAMGKTGTDVSKEASDMVLADDNFASIVAAVEEGRHIFENILKIILYTLPTNGGQSLLILGAVLLVPFIPLFVVRLPLEPLQILWINLFDAVFLALPLIKEPKEKGFLEKPPRDPEEPIVNILFLRKVGLVSFSMAIAGLTIYYHFGISALSNPMNELLLTQAQTAAFATVILMHIFYLFTARSITDSAFTFSPFSNKWVLIGAAITMIALFMIVYAPFFQILFRTAAFPGDWWIFITFAALPGFFLIEIEKFLEKSICKKS